jgi:hypothetical protein
MASADEAFAPIIAIDPILLTMLNVARISLMTVFVLLLFHLIIRNIGLSRTPPVEEQQPPVERPILEVQMV